MEKAKPTAKAEAPTFQVPTAWLKPWIDKAEIQHYHRGTDIDVVLVWGRLLDLWDRTDEQLGWYLTLGCGCTLQSCQPLGEYTCRSVAP